MRKQFLTLLFTLVLGALFALPAAAQMATVKGAVIGQDGKPLPNAKVEFVNKDNGQKYNLKTDKQGKFFSIGITSGKYKVTLYGQDNKELTFYDNIVVSLAKEENVVDFNLQQMAAEAATGIPAQTGSGQQRKLTPEEQKALEEAAKQRAEAEKEVATVKNLNQMLASSKTAADAGNIDEAITTMKQAVAVDATRDILWAVLGDYQLRAAKKPGTDTATRKQLNSDAAESYQKAIAACSGAKPPSSCKDLASYHNNLGQAFAGMGSFPEAIAQYEKAAQINPAGAGQYYFNEGAILTNSGKVDEANAAFDKAIAADPARADAYYQKGVNLLAKATIKDGKMVAPPEAETNIKKYLELQPAGPYAESAKQLLETLGTSIQTTYGTKGKKK